MKFFGKPWPLGGLLALLLVGVVALPTTNAQAAPATDTSGLNLTLSPLPVSLSAVPGQAVNTTLRIQNSGTKPTRIKMSVMKFKASTANGKAELVEPTAQDEYIKWASFSPSNFVAQPNVYNTVKMTIKVPKSAAFGYYYAAVFSGDNGNPVQVSASNKISGAVASLVLLDVQAPGEKRQLDVVSFKATKKVYQYLPATFTVRVKNTGNIHTVPSGNIFIGRQNKGQFIDTLSINETQGNVLPKSEREFTATWNSGFPSYQTKTVNGQVLSDKEGQPIKELSWDLKNANEFRIGRYTASMTLVYNDGKQDVPINGEVSFWVIPWIPFLIILAIVMLIGVGVFVLVRSAVRKARRVRKKSA